MIGDDLKNREIVIPHTSPRPGWPCPACGGLGHRADGSISIGQTETRIRQPSKCHVCNGKGRVICTPIADEEPRR